MGPRPWIGALLLLAGCEVRLDVTQPIALDPEGAWTDVQRISLENAAETWNVEIGTRLTVSGPAEQRVPFRLSQLVCAFTNGVTTTRDSVEVQLCSIDAESPWLLFPLALHEMGHVVNIRGHVDDPDAVMSPESGGDRRFTAEDRALFYRANPGFHPAGDCDVARPVAMSEARPIPVRTAGGLYLLWAAADGVQVGTVDPNTARVRRAGQIPAAAYPQWIRAAEAPGGLWVTWVEGGDLRLAHLRLPGLEVGAPLTLDLDRHDYQRVIEVSIAPGDTDLFVAITEGLDSPTLYLSRLSRTTGARRPLPHASYVSSWGYLVPFGSGPVLAMRNRRGVTLQRWSSADGAFIVTQQVVHFSDNDRAVDPFRAEVVDGALVLALFSQGHPVELHRVESMGQGFDVTRRQEVALPGEGNTLLSVDGSGAGLLLALSSSREEHPTDEVYVMRFAADTLEPTAAWRRLSAPDQVPSLQPWVIAGPGRNLVVWRDLHDMETIEVKARCF